MANLHLISHSLTPDSFNLNQQRLVNHDDAFLFIGDAVLSVLNNNIVESLNNNKTYVLAADGLCRGIDKLIPAHLEKISDATMVELSLAYQQIISW